MKKQSTYSEQVMLQASKTHEVALRLERKALTLERCAANAIKRAFSDLTVENDTLRFASRLGISLKANELDIVQNLASANWFYDMGCK